MRTIIKYFLLYGLFLLFVFPAYSQVTGVKLVLRVPQPDTGSRPVYVAGNFNHWYAEDSLYRLSKIGEGTYMIVLPVFAGKMYEYKYTRGGWDRVELSAADSNRINRRFTAMAGLVQEDLVEKWKMPEPVIEPAKRAGAINSKLDTLKSGLKSQMDKLTAALKKYMFNMLSDHPKRSIQNKLDRRATKKLGDIYKKLTGIVWDVLTQLPPDEKKRLREFLANPGAQKDFMKAFGKVLDGSAK